jgi:hypothetical protein
MAGSGLFNGAGSAGVLATSERLYRLAPEHARVAYQSRFVGVTAGAVGTGALVCTSALALAPSAGWAVYAALYAGSAFCRFAATLRADVAVRSDRPARPASEPSAAREEVSSELPP